MAEPYSMGTALGSKRTDELIAELRKRGFVVQAQQSYDNCLTAIETRDEEIVQLEVELDQAKGRAV